MAKKNFEKLIFGAIAFFMVLTMGCTPQEDGAGADDGKTRIVLLLNGYLGDLAWYDVSAAGIAAIQEKYTDDVYTEVIEMTLDQSKYDSIIADTLNSDWDVIVAGSWTMMEYIQEAALDYPEKEFWFFDEPIEGYENIYSMQYAANEGSFLAGMVAGYASETGVIGFIGGADSTTVNDAMVGYLEGARYVNPDVKAIVSYTGNWDDSAKGKELSLVQYNAGADVIFQLASNAGVGLFEAAKEVGKLAIGSDTDQSLLFEESDPAKADVIVTSSLKRVDDSLVYAYEQYVNGTIPYGTVEKLGLEKGGVGIVENDNLRSAITADQIANINKAKEDIIAGNIIVSSAYGMSNEDVSAFRESFSN